MGHSEQEHDELIRLVDDKLNKIDRKLDVTLRTVKETRDILGEVRRVEFQVERGRGNGPPTTP